MADHDEIPDGRVVALLERTLSARAASASAPPDLAVRARARRRHRAVQWAATGGAGLAVAAAVAVPMALAGGDLDPVTAVDTPRPTEAAPDTPVYTGLPAVEPAADGWRWEFYRGVELQVPDAWQTGGTHQPWCAAVGPEGAEVAPAPYVSRPGATLAVLCGPEPVERWVPYVEFGGIDEVGREELEAGWLRETVQVGEVEVTVRADDADLLDRIVSSARVIADLDAIGCPLTYPGADTLDARPTTGALYPAEVGPDGAVCQYTLGYSTGPAMLTGSYRMPADDVTAFVDAVDAAPAGSGPDSPPGCTPDHRRGDEAVLVRVPTTDGLREVVVWYAAGCGNGADDGVTLHTLTADLLRPLFQGAVQASGFSMAVAPLFQGADQTS